MGGGSSKKKQKADEIEDAVGVVPGSGTSTEPSMEAKTEDLTGVARPFAWSGENKYWTWRDGEGPSNGCVHRHIDTWDGGANWHCMACKAAIENAKRIAEVKAAMQKAIAGDTAAFGPDPHPGGNAESLDKSAAASYGRGVTVEWLIAFTDEHELWDDVPTWVVQQRFIKPLTEAARCRFTDLPEMQNAACADGTTKVVGPADVFMSHTWGAPWGDLVAAASDHASATRRVWIDLFAVRQWPGNVADLEFSGVVARCTAMIVVCTSNQPEIHEQCPQEGWGGIAAISEMPAPAKKKVAFARVWCLVELDAALRAAVPVVMKIGRVRQHGKKFKNQWGMDETYRIPGKHFGALRDLGANRGFEGDKLMALQLTFLVDVEQAEATVVQDRDRIIANVRAAPGGAAALNSLVMGAIKGAEENLSWTNDGSEDPGLMSAACGDMEALRLKTRVSVAGKGRALRHAAAGGYLVPLQALLDAGADVNDADKQSGHTALYKAGQGGHFATIEILLSAGAEVDARERMFGRSALMQAALYGHVKAIQALLAGGADIDGKSKARETALVLAAERGHTPALQTLLQAGADVTVENYSALFEAGKGGHAATMDALLTAGGDANAKLSNSNGTTLLMKVCDKDHIGFKSTSHIAVIDVLLKHGADVAAKDDNGDGALAYAASTGRTEATEVLLKGGADPNSKNKQGCTALMRAATEGHVSTVEALLNAGADTEAQDAIGNDYRVYLLLGAARKGDAATIENAIAQGVDVNVTNPDGETALIAAASAAPHMERHPARLVCEEHTEAVAALLKGGADPRSKDRHGMTALMYASERSHFAVVEALLNAGDDADAKVGITSTGSDEAKATSVEYVDGDGDVCKFELEDGVLKWYAIGKEEDTHIVTSFQWDPTGPNAGLLTDQEGWGGVIPASCRDETIEKLSALAKSAGVSLFANEGMNALMWAIERNQGGRVIKDPAFPVPCSGEREKTVGHLLKAGTDLDAQDSRGRTALMCAAVDNDTASAVALLEAGASIAVTDKDGMSAVMLAARGGTYTECIDVVDVLLERGANTKLKATGGKYKGSTALQIATKAGKTLTRDAIEAFEDAKRLPEERIRRLVQSSCDQYGAARDVYLKVLFESIDTDGDGHITLEEFQLFVAGCANSRGGGCRVPTAAEVEATFRLIDLDSNGTIEFNEFEIFVEFSKSQCYYRIRELIEATSDLDQLAALFAEATKTNDDGLNPAEFTALIRACEAKYDGGSVDVPVSEADIDATFRYIDMSENGLIEMDELEYFFFLRSKKK